MYEWIDGGTTSGGTAVIWIWNVPQGLCVKGLIPRLLLLGGGRTLKRWGPVEGIRSLGCDFKGEYETSVSLSSFLLLPNHKARQKANTRMEVQLQMERSALTDILVIEVNGETLTRKAGNKLARLLLVEVFLLHPFMFECCSSTNRFESSN
jgi:hypothetical protein